MVLQEEIIQILNDGVIQKRQGNYQKALSYYAQANQLDHTNIWTYYNPAKVQFIIGEYIEAIENYKKASHISIVNMLNRIDKDEFEATIWLIQLNQFSATEQRKYKAIDKNAIFLLIDNNTPNHLGRALIMLNKSTQSDEILLDLEKYSLGIQGKGGKPNMKLDAKYFEPMGRDYLLKNLNWFEIEKRNLDVNLIY